MDLNLYGRVFWRFRVVIALGVVLALALAFLATARVDLASGKVTYRGKEQWAAYSQIFVTQPGFPYGTVPTPDRDPAALAPNAIFYANIADSDAVLKLAFGSKPPPGKIEAAALTTSPGSTDALPIVSIAGLADTAAKAMFIARAETSGLITHILRQQDASRIAPADRVMLQVIKEPKTAQLLGGRPKTVPIIVFLTVLIATLGLVFVLENLRPRIRVIEDQDQDQMRRANVEDAKSRTA